MFALELALGSAPLIDSSRLAATLSAGTGWLSGADQGDGWAAARQLATTQPRVARAWRAARLDDHVVLFNGFLSNAAAVAAQLGRSWPDRPGPDDYARLYALHRLRRGVAGETELIGEYAAAILHPPSRRLTLVRSPLRAPPLHFAVRGGTVRAASVPRALFADAPRPPLDAAKLADAAWFNYGTDRLGWYEQTDRLLPGSQIEWGPDGVRRQVYYDPAALPAVRLARPDDYVEAANALLDAAIGAALQGFSAPGIMLSGGLDSPLVAARAVPLLDAGSRLKGFTFKPQADWDGRSPPGTFGDESDMVAAFAARHPQIAVRYFDNAGLGFDHRMAEMFHHTGIAPINLANFSQFHEPFRAARAEGCDVMLVPEWGNETFSNAGEWAFTEYLLTLRWGQLIRALRALPDDPRPLWRRLVGSSLLPLLPPALWRWQRRLRGKAEFRTLASPLRADFVARAGLAERSARSPGALTGLAARSRTAWLRNTLVSAADDAADVWQGFEQIHGLPVRDPAAYRPLAEFCFGLPTDLFVRDGEDRWLARQMGRTLLPETQRTNRRIGRHNADWLAKLRPKRAALRAEVLAYADSPDLAEMLDLPRLLAALDAWPETTPLGEDGVVLQTALTRGVTLARFVAWADGRNLPS